MRRFILTLDDYSPKPKTDDLFWCDRLIYDFPSIKIDLFVPAACARLGDDPYYLSGYPLWVNKTKKLPKNYRISVHGLHHRRSKKDFKWHVLPESNNNEWEKLSYRQAEVLLNRTEEEFKKAGIKHSKVFRPSGWHIGLNSIKLLIDRGYKIAGSQQYYNKFRNKIPDLNKYWTSYNWDLIGKCGVKKDIYAFGHTSTWTTNCMNEERYNIIKDLLDKETFKFSFI